MILFPEGFAAIPTQSSLMSVTTEAVLDHLNAGTVRAVHAPLIGTEACKSILI